MKSTKEHIIASLIVVMSFIVIGISVSYAFFEISVKTIGETKLSVTSGSLVMNFETLNGQYINVPSANLIKDSDITSTNNYTSFSVELSSSANVDSATYNLYLTDIKMTSNFKSRYLKWALYDDNNNPIIANGIHVKGDFANVNLLKTCQVKDEYNMCDVENIVLSNASINKGSKHSYRLYIWLSYDENVLQNELLKGSFEAKVGFKGVTN